ncbi:hypothetical protein GA0070616_4600 [Micromonospora nigra]|uniref:Uncharacterized protein n=1 Tax=Micromonospora nigra TaxID=145857 RepID=A0A1C6STV4_9ACTN|nr:hypothetical protein [Micromonospora nigra]SCL32961.1 hypothetical protein GA0070616_4600 [Micromonospora nigra]
MSYVSNHEDTITTDAAEFAIAQRNIGFADNDGRWIVSQLPDLYWSPIGVLRQRRPGAFLGAFDTREVAEAAISAAQPLPEQDAMVPSMGRVSC